MLTGALADPENNFELTTDIFKCDKPIESINDAHCRIAKAVASVEKMMTKNKNILNCFMKSSTKNTSSRAVAS